MFHLNQRVKRPTCIGNPCQVREKYMDSFKFIQQKKKYIIKFLKILEIMSSQNDRTLNILTLQQYCR